MILTITLNPAIDIRYEIDNFEINSIFRGKGSKTAGGKGHFNDLIMHKFWKKMEVFPWKGYDSHPDVMWH